MVDSARRERLAEQERREWERVARANAAGESGSTGAASAGVVEHNLDWSYHYDNIYIPPTYKADKAELEKGLFTSKHHWVVSEDLPAYTGSDLDSLYFSVKLKNRSGRKVRVQVKISAREKVSVSRAVGNAWDATLFAAAGAGLAAWLDEDPQVGAVLGAGYALADQKSHNRLFNKEKTFSTILAPNEQSYDTGQFPVNKTLSENPTLEILSVEYAD